MSQVMSKLPEWTKKPLRHVRDAVRAVPYYGEGRWCPVCGKSSSRFRTFGIIRREDAQCAHCGALERHRLLWLFLSTKTDLFDGKAKKMLHVAPELCFENRFKRLLGSNYITADLLDNRAVVKMDITNIQCPDQSFDVVYCSHVLEHVPDDRRAMREFYRVLKNDGWAILLVPINSEKTFEDPTVTSPEERLKVFGQKDHVRRYGPDYVNRLREAGFNVESTRVSDLVNREEAEKMGLTGFGEAIYYCTK
jgi:SAM-dependent methyltransferase